MSQIVEFLRGSGPDNKGRYIKDILNWNDDKLEHVHDYIQWVFPLNEPSQFNPDAPLLTPKDIKAIQEKGIYSIFSFLLVFLEFLERGQDSANPQYWLVPANHNHLRISRMIKCFKLFESNTVVGFLLDKMNEYNRLHGGVLDNAMVHWKQAAGR